MSFQAMTWATEQELPAMQKIVLLMMANRTNHETGMCYPSHDLLAKECGMDKRSVIRQIEKLELCGLVDVVRSLNDKGEKNVNQYRLNLKFTAKNDNSRSAQCGSDRESLGGSDRESHKPVTIEPKKETTNVVSKKTDEKRNGERLMLDILPEAWRQFCHDERPGLDADTVFARFRDYWIAQPGVKGRKLDWSATWRNWVRNENGVSNGSHQQSGQHRKLSAVELVQQASRRYEDAAADRRRNEKIVGSAD